MRRKLAEKGYDAAVVDGVVDRVKAEHLVDDRRFVENFVAAHAERGQGPLRVRAELRKFGQLGTLVDESLQAYPDWVEQARKLRQRKFGATAPGSAAERARQARFLGYRGFTSAQVRGALGFDVELDLDRDDQDL